VKLSSRQREFLSRLLDLYREAEAPVHYVDLARALDVSPVTAYEMLRLLEDKGLVYSETVRPQGHRGRSVVVFSPTGKATALLSELMGYQGLLDELLLRIPERTSPLLFAADMVTAIILVFYELRDTSAARRLFPHLRWFGPPGWAALYSLAGFSLALSLVEKANRRATSLLLSYSQQFREHLDNLTGKDKTRLSDFVYEVLQAVGL